MKHKILMTNNTLDFRSGTELYLRDVALSLQKRGHLPVAYSTRLGQVAEDLRQAGVTVTDDLQTIPFVPDIIHGQHHLETLCALMHFARTPAVFFCHGTVPWEETPPCFPRIYRYVAVDENSARRVLDETKTGPDRVSVISNFVDLTRFRPRGPLPERPRKAALFSSTIQRDRIPLIQQACRRRRVDLELLGMVSGKVCRHPEQKLIQYDLVLAKGRAALESLAVGASVLLCDYSALGPMVSSGNLDRLRRFNLGLSCLDRPLTVANLVAEIDRYDAQDTAQVSARIRSEAGCEAVVDRILQVYQLALEDHGRATPDPNAELQESSSYLKWLGAALQERERQSRRLLDELDQLNRTFTIRLRNRILNLPLLGRGIRRLLMGG